MKHLTISGLLLSIILFSGFITFNAHAAEPGSSVESGSIVSEKTATFTVENMYCAMCPITVRKAMEGVDGVKTVTVDYETKTATVVFDATMTTVEKIGRASTDVGYPAKPAS